MYDLQITEDLSYCRRVYWPSYLSFRLLDCKFRLLFELFVDIVYFTLI